jgi:N4-gp56 family major capsid protein
LKFGSLAVATTPLSEGVTPIGVSISPTAITATVDQYGAWIQHSDLIDKLSIDPIVTEESELLGSRIN